MKSAVKTVTIAEAAKLLAKKNNIALFAHTNPDGDTLGVSVALGKALSRLGKNVKIFCDTPIGDKLKKEFPETGEILREFVGKYDLMVAVDSGDLGKLGEFGGIYNSFRETLTMDHHGGEFYSAYNLVTDYASTCQIAYKIIKELSVPLDSVISTYLYMGLCTDTGNFSHNNTDKFAFLTAAELCDHGADMERVNRVFFKDASLTETKLLGRALEHLRTFYDGKMILMYLTQSDMKQFDAQIGDTSGIVQHAINVDTAKVGVMLTEYSQNNYKVSMRGKDFSVRDVCREFGGGGHMYASGCMIGGFLEDVIEKIVRVVGYTI